MNPTPPTSPSPIPDATPTSVEPSCGPLPDAFWAAVDHLLHNPEEICRRIREEIDLPALIRFFTKACLALGVLYGVVMGLLNLLQGEAMPMWEKAIMPVVCGVKIPVLNLATLLIILPPIYVMNAFAGAKLRFRKVVSIMLLGTTVTLVLLSSLASVALFFSLTSRNPSFVKLLHTVFFVAASWVGWSQMLVCVRAVSARPGTRVLAMPKWLTLFWAGLHVFVTLEMAWAMRPYFGTPGKAFELFRPRGGNLIEAVGGWTESWFKNMD